MTKDHAMRNVSATIEALLQNLTGRDDIYINYNKITGGTYGTLALYSQRDVDRFHLMTGEEYFFITEDNVKETSIILYAVNVTGDSYLTAAAELMALIANKF